MRRDTLWVTLAAAGMIMASSTGCTSTSWLGNGGSWGTGSWFAKKPAGAPDTSIAKSEGSSWFKWPSWAGGSDEVKTEENDPTSMYTKTKTVSPELYEGMAAAAERQGKYVEAIKQYQAGLKAHPDNIALYMGMARAYDRAGNSEYAIQTYQRVIKVDPKFAKVHNDMALCLARNKDLPAAVQSMDKAIALDPKSELYRNNMATMLVDMGQHEAALGQMQAVQPQAVAHFNVGYLLQSRGQAALAAKYLNKALEYDPSLTRAQSLLNKVEAMAATGGNAGQEAVAQVARAGSDVADRWKMKASAAGEAMGGYGKAAAQQAYGDVEQRANAVRARVGDMANEVQAKASNAVQQTESSVYGQVEQAEKSVYGRVKQTQASVYEKVDRAEQKVQKTLGTYVPSAPRGGAAPSSLKTPVESAYGDGSGSSASTDDSEAAIRLGTPDK